MTKITPFVLFLTLSCVSHFAAAQENAPQNPAFPAAPPEATPTDQEIKQILIQRSIRSYSGNCPCPYNSASNGSRCGGRSAWTRAGGAKPLCYEADVSDAMLRNYRNSQR